MRHYLTLTALLACAVVWLPALAQAQDTEWRTIETFEGMGMKNTSPFTVEASEWRIVWESEATMQDGIGHIFQLFLKKPGTELPTELPANVANVARASDISYVYESGRFYLQANAANGKWRVQVQVPGR